MNSAVLSGFLAAAAAIAATVFVERLGGRLGGLLAAVPSTIVPASLGFWWAAGSLEVYQEALFAVPGGMLINALFLLCWRVFPARFPSRRVNALLAGVTIASLVVWLVMAAGLVALAKAAFVPLSVLGFTCCGLQIAAGLKSCWSNTPAPKGSRSVGLVTLACRGALAGSAVGLSVWLSGLGIPLVAGIASVFPAIFLTTMVSVWLAQGQAVPLGAVGPIMLGSSSVSVYALSAVWMLPLLGSVAGVCVSWVFAVLVVSVPAWHFLRWRVSTTSAPDPAA